MLEDFCPHNIHHLWVQPSLMVNNRFSIGLEVDSMLTDRWTNPIAPRCLRSTSNNRSSSYPERLELIITGYTFFSSKYAYLSVSGRGLRSNTGSSFGLDRIPKGSTGRLCFRIAGCLKKISSISFLSCIWVSFSWSSMYCCKGSLGGIAIEAILSIILSSLGDSVPRGTLEILEK